MRRLDLNQRPSGYENLISTFVSLKVPIYVSKVTDFYTFHTIIYVIFMVFHWRKGTVRV